MYMYTLGKLELAKEEFCGHQKVRGKGLELLPQVVAGLSDQMAELATDQVKQAVKQEVWMATLGCILRLSLVT